MDYEKLYKEALGRAKSKLTNEVASDIFPELKENADERIRSCIELALTDVNEQRFTDFGVTLKDCLAYLKKQKELDKMIVVSPEVWDSAISDAFENGKKEGEKQKERKPTAEEVLIKAGLKPYRDGNQWCILVGNNIQEGICGFGDTIEDALYQFLLEILDLQSKQKPAECIEDSIKFKEGFKAGRESGLRDGQKYVLNNLDSYGLCKSAEWIAEDSRILYNVIAYVGYAAGQRGVRDDEFKEANSWLKSLPMGFIVNPNYNEDMVNLLVGELQSIAERNGAPRQYDAEITWLKSLRPQSHWKPSEEQIEALRRAINKLAESDMADSVTLSIMYDNLKKLM